MVLLIHHVTHPTVKDDLMICIQRHPPRLLLPDRSHSSTSLTPSITHTSPPPHGLTSSRLISLIPLPLAFPEPHLTAAARDSRCRRFLQISLTPWPPAIPLLSLGHSLTGRAAAHRRHGEKTPLLLPRFTAATSSSSRSRRSWRWSSKEATHWEVGTGGGSRS